MRLKLVASQTGRTAGVSKSKLLGLLASPVNVSGGSSVQQFQPHKGGGQVREGIFITAEGGRGKT